jgi:tetrahydrodipicolinate N-succinyltransferase
MEPRPLLLVGGGGLAREVLAAVRLLPEKWKPIGVLDDDRSRHDIDLDGVPVTHVVAMPHVLITHDAEIADGVTFAGRASLGGNVVLGECAYLGQAASVRERVTIGAGAVVGMGSVVLQDVPAGEVWAENSRRKFVVDAARLNWTYKAPGRGTISPPPSSLPV